MPVPDPPTTRDLRGLKPHRAPMNPERITKTMRLAGARVIPSGNDDLNVRRWRHVHIAIARKYLVNDNPWDLSANDDAPEDEYDPAVNLTIDLQAAHTSATANTQYARGEMSQAGTVTGAHFQSFLLVTEAFHEILKVKNFAATSRPPPIKAAPDDDHFDSSASFLSSVERLHSMRTFACSARAFKELTGDERFEPNEFQLLVIRSICTSACRDHLIVAGTGSGKSEVYMLLAKGLGYAEYVVVVTPLTALTQGAATRHAKYGLDVGMFNAGDLQSGPGSAKRIMFVQPEHIDTPAFKAYLKHLGDRLDIVVVDEVHMLLEGSQSFRPELRNMAMLRDTSAKLRIFMTGTAPPSLEKDISDGVGLKLEDTNVLRTSCNRPNLRYAARECQWPQEAEEHAMDEVSDLPSNTRAILFCRTDRKSVV